MNFTRKRRQICIFTLNDSGKGGVGSRSTALAKHLETKYDIKVVRLEIQDIFQPISLKSAFRSFLNLVSDLRNADLVISFSSIPNLFNSLISKRSIVSLSGSTFYRRDTPLLSRIYWTFILEPLYVLFSDAVVPASPAVLQPFLSGVSILNYKMKGIYGFLDCDLIDHCMHRRVNEYSWIGDGYLLFIGELIEQKGILELIDVYASLPGDIGEVQVPLVICGRGELLPEIVTRCSRLSISIVTTRSEIHSAKNGRSIILLGFVPEPYSLIHNSAVVLAPFFWEGLSNVILESLYLNTPVIATLNPSSLYIMQILQWRCSKSQSNVLQLVGHPLSDSDKDIWKGCIMDVLDSQVKAWESCAIIYDNFSAEKNQQRWFDLIESTLAS